MIWNSCHVLFMCRCIYFIISYLEVDFGLYYSLTELLCRYPAEPLTAALLQLHSTIC